MNYTNDTKLVRIKLLSKTKQGTHYIHFLIPQWIDRFFLCLMPFLPTLPGICAIKIQHPLLMQVY